MRECKKVNDDLVGVAEGTNGQFMKRFVLVIALFAFADSAVYGIGVGWWNSCYVMERGNPQLIQTTRFELHASDVHIEPDGTWPTFSAKLSSNNFDPSLLFFSFDPVDIVTYIEFDYEPFEGTKYFKFPFYIYLKDSTLPLSLPIMEEIGGQTLYHGLSFEFSSSDPQRAYFNHLLELKVSENSGGMFTTSVIMYPRIYSIPEPATLLLLGLGGLALQRKLRAK